MKPPPFLLGTALLFWGWQTGFLIVGALMAAALESARWFQARWEFDDDDFSRIWTFCSLLFLAALVLAFTANKGPADFLGLFQNPGYISQRNAGVAGARTAAAVIRWLPMIFFLFVAAQTFSAREGIPLETISLILRRRWKKARELGLPVPPSRSINVSYPYFAICLFAASIHPGDNLLFFWGLCGLLSWALWPQRSRRFGIGLWFLALAAAITLGFFGQGGLSRLSHYLESFNPQWLSNFMHRGFDPAHSKTAIGQIGRAKTSGKIVIRLEPKNQGSVPGLLREATYRTYKAQVWYAGSARSEFETLLPEMDKTTWLLLPEKTNAAAVNIACYLDGGRSLLPLPAGSGRLENLPAYVLQKNNLGAVLAFGPGLVMFDAQYGPGATIDSPPLPGSSGNTNEDLAVPLKETLALDQVLAELQLTEQTPLPQTLRAISGHFLGKFTYSLWQEGNLSTTKETPLTRFLLRTRSGHCEYFASATVLLLRRLGIPARYAVGYAVHEAVGTKYVVRMRDAHSWCLVWDPNKNLWQDFDTTPASWIEAEANRASPLQFLSDMWTRLGFEISKIRWGQTSLRQYLLWALVPILAVLLYRSLFGAGRRRRRRKNDQPVAPISWPGLDSEFYQVETTLAEAGLTRQPSEPLSGWLARATAAPELAALRGSLQELLRLHYRFRFDPQGLKPAERELLRRDAKACLTNLALAQQAAVRR